MLRDRLGDKVGSAHEIGAKPETQGPTAGDIPGATSCHVSFQRQVLSSGTDIFLIERNARPRFLSSERDFPQCIDPA